MNGDDEKRFRVRVAPSQHAKSYALPGEWGEPVEAVFAAEDKLNVLQFEKSHAAIYFNGDSEPHYLLFWLGENRVGLFNTDACRWPIYIPENSSDFKNQLTDVPWDIEQPPPGDDAQDDTPGTDKKSDDDADSFGVSDSEDNEDDADTEDEPMRLKFFTKMRGPKGWRKRAESNLDRDRNTFVWRVGVLDWKGNEERTVAHATFTERDKDRRKATLMLTLPEGSEIKANDARDRVEITIPTQA